MRILVVDDVSYNTVLLERLLAKEGHEVMTAHSVEQALRLLSQLTVPIDVVISDLMMPGDDGVALLNGAHKLYWNQGKFDDLDMPTFILLTASRDEVQIDKAISEGFTDVLKKPIDKHALFSMLSKIKKEPVQT